MYYQIFHQMLSVTSVCSLQLTGNLTSCCGVRERWFIVNQQRWDKKKMVYSQSIKIGVERKMVYSESIKVGMRERWFIVNQSRWR